MHPPEQPLGYDNPNEGKVPFSDLLIASLPNDISPKEFDTLANSSHQHDLSYITAQTVRKAGDLSGFASICLCDVARTPEDVFDILHPIGTQAIATINALPDDFRETVYGTLNQQKVTPQSILWLDALYGEKILKPIQAYRKPNGLREKIQTIIRENHGYTNTNPLIQLHPVFTENNALDYINYSYHIPVLPNEIIKQILALSPNFLQRDNQEHHDVTTVRGLFQKIGLLGIPITREFALYIKQAKDLISSNQQFKTQMEPFLEWTNDRP